MFDFNTDRWFICKLKQLATWDILSSDFVMTSMQNKLVSTKIPSSSMEVHPAPSQTISERGFIHEMGQEPMRSKHSCQKVSLHFEIGFF